MRPKLLLKNSGKTRVQQHQMVYNAMGGRMGKELHALALNTSALRNKGELNGTNYKDKIQNIIDENDVLLFMKGTSHASMREDCRSFNHMGIKYNSVNVPKILK